MTPAPVVVAPGAAEGTSSQIALVRTVVVVLVAGTVAVRVSPVDSLGQIAARVGVLVLATLGALLLARAGAPAAPAATWAPWLAGLLYGCGPVLVASALADPASGLVAAALPWAALPLVRGRTLTAFALSGAVLLLACAGPLPWAVALALTGAVAVGYRARPGGVRGTAVWLAVAASAAAWWWVGPIQHSAGTTPSDLDPYTGTLLAGSDLVVVWLVLMLAQPVLVLLAALTWRRSRLTYLGTGWAAAGLGLVLWHQTSTALPAGQTYRDAGLALVSLAGCLVLTPVVVHLASLRGRRASAALLVIVVTAVASLLGAAHERGRDTPLAQAIAGLSTQTYVAAPSGTLIARMQPTHTT